MSGLNPPDSWDEPAEDAEKCPSCGEPYVSKMRTPEDAICFACRYASEADDA